MVVEQAIFTSMARRGRSGYHLVTRSPGITENEAKSLVLWAPSHGGLIVDDENRASTNFHPLPSGRFALSRSCEGRPEYSGRGSKQVYTHFLVFDVETLAGSDYRPFAIYRDALALGYFHYHPDPETVLKPVRLSKVYPTPAERVDSELVKGFGRRLFDSLVVQVNAGQEVAVPYTGERLLLAEALVNSLPAESLIKTSFATSLVPSSVRPYRIHIIPPQANSASASASAAATAGTHRAR